PPAGGLLRRGQPEGAWLRRRAARVSAALRFDGLEIAERIEPKDAEALAAALRECGERGGAVRGGGGESPLEIGNPLRRADAVLETRRLDRLLELDADEG